MKTLKFLSISVLLAFLAIADMNAQNAVLSGSFQFTNDINKRVGTLVLQSSTQKFDAPISENIIIANLLPGRYSLTVEFQSGGKYGSMTKLSQMIDIESERRTVCRMNASAVLTFAKEYDRNSVLIAVNNYGGGNNQYYPDGNRDRDRDKVVVLPAPVPMPASDADFNNLYNSVRSENFSKTKMQTLKTSSSFYQYFTSDQVRRLAALFTTDGDKLDCVKYLAPKVLDVQNLPFIKDVFSFDSTKKEYLNFLNRMR